MLYRVKMKRLEPSTLYTKYKVHTTRLGYLFFELHFHHLLIQGAWEPKWVSVLACITCNACTPNGDHASHACLHVLHPHMHCMHGGTYKNRAMKWGKGMKGNIEIKYSNKLLTSLGKWIISQGLNQGFKPEFWQKKSRILRSSIVSLVKSCIHNIKLVFIIYYCFLNYTWSLSCLCLSLSNTDYF